MRPSSSARSWVSGSISTQSTTTPGEDLSVARADRLEPLMNGESLVEGETGSVATGSDLRAYVGIAPDLFAANAGFRTFMTAFYKDQRYDGDALLHQQNPFARRNVTGLCWRCRAN
jgi:hypothetical protein